MSHAVFVQPPHTVVQIDIVRDADWNDPMPPMMDGNVPLDLTGKTLELFIRPTYDHGILILKLSSVGRAGIVIDDAVNGLATFYVERPDVMQYLPVGSWSQFLILKEPSDDLEGFAVREIWRGLLVVHPGRV